MSSDSGSNKMKKKIDPRLTRAVKAGEKVRRAAQAKKDKSRSYETDKERRRIASFSKRSDEWVENSLFKLIAEAEAEGSNRVRLYCNDPPYVPEEALVKAVKKIDGLTVENKWIEDWNDPDCGLIQAAHYEYYVKWKSDPYENYPY